MDAEALREEQLGADAVDGCDQGRGFGVVGGEREGEGAAEAADCAVRARARGGGSEGGDKFDKGVTIGDGDAG